MHISYTFKYSYYNLLSFKKVNKQAPVNTILMYYREQIYAIHILRTRKHNWK